MLYLELASLASFAYLLYIIWPIALVIALIKLTQNFKIALFTTGTTFIISYSIGEAVFAAVGGLAAIFSFLYFLIGDYSYSSSTLLDLVKLEEEE
jgi:hypothetical protein